MELPQQLCGEMLMPWWLFTLQAKKLLSSVGASLRYIRWNKVSAPTCLLSANGWMVCLLREASGTAMTYTISVHLASSAFVKLRCV